MTDVCKRQLSTRRKKILQQRTFSDEAEAPPARAGRFWRAFAQPCNGFPRCRGRYRGLLVTKSTARSGNQRTAPISNLHDVTHRREPCRAHHPWLEEQNKCSQGQTAACCDSVIKQLMNLIPVSIGLNCVDLDGEHSYRKPSSVRLTRSTVAVVFPIGSQLPLLAEPAARMLQHWQPCPYLAESPAHLILTEAQTGAVNVGSVYTIILQTSSNAPSVSRRFKGPCAAGNPSTIGCDFLHLAEVHNWIRPYRASTFLCLQLWLSPSIEPSQLGVRFPTILHRHERA